MVCTNPPHTSTKYNFSVSAALLHLPEPVKCLPKCVKFASSWGSTPDPAGGTYDAPPDSLVGWGGGYSNGSLVLGACGVQSQTPSSVRLVTGLRSACKLLCSKHVLFYRYLCVCLSAQKLKTTDHKLM